MSKIKFFRVSFLGVLFSALISGGCAGTKEESGGVHIGNGQEDYSSPYGYEVTYNTELNFFKSDDDKTVVLSNEDLLKKFAAANESASLMDFIIPVAVANDNETEISTLSFVARDEKVADGPALLQLAIADLATTGVDPETIKLDTFNEIMSVTGIDTSISGLVITHNFLRLKSEQIIKVTLMEFEDNFGSYLLGEAYGSMGDGSNPPMMMVVEAVPPFDVPLSRFRLDGAGRNSVGRVSPGSVQEVRLSFPREIESSISDVRVIVQQAPSKGRGFVEQVFSSREGTVEQWDADIPFFVAGGDVDQRKESQVMVDVVIPENTPFGEYRVLQIQAKIGGNWLELPMFELGEDSVRAIEVKEKSYPIEILSVSSQQITHGPWTDILVTVKPEEGFDAESILEDMRYSVVLQTDGRNPSVNAIAMHYYPRSASQNENGTLTLNLGQSGSFEHLGVIGVSKIQMYKETYPSEDEELESEYDYEREIFGDSTENPEFHNPQIDGNALPGSQMIGYNPWNYNGPWSQGAMWSYGSNPYPYAGMAYR